MNLWFSNAELKFDLQNSTFRSRNSQEAKGRPRRQAWQRLPAAVICRNRLRADRVVQIFEGRIGFRGLGALVDLGNLFFWENRRIVDCALAFAMRMRPRWLYLPDGTEDVMWRRESAEETNEATIPRVEVDRITARCLCSLQLG